MLKILYLATLLVFTTSTFAWAQKTKLGPTEIKAIDQLFERFDQDDSPGYAVGVFYKDQPLYTRGYGMADLDHNIPISDTSVFNVASITKQFTGACIAQLILDGKLGMEDRVDQFFPEVKKYPHEIKIKHLLYMTSGLKEYYRLPRPSGLSWSPYEYFTIDTAIQVSLRQPELDFAPGTRNAYSNINYMMLARIVEMVSEQNIDEFAQERIFKPLGMKHTHINTDVTRLIKNRAWGYNFNDEEKGVERINLPPPKFSPLWR